MDSMSNAGEPDEASSGEASGQSSAGASPSTSEMSLSSSQVMMMSAAYLYSERKVAVRLTSAKYTSGYICLDDIEGQMDPAPSI